MSLFSSLIDVTNKNSYMHLNETRPFQFDELFTLLRVENTCNATKQAIESKMTFSLFRFLKTK